MVALLAVREFYSQLTAQCAVIVDALYTAEILAQHSAVEQPAEGTEPSSASDENSSAYLLAQVRRSILHEAALFSASSCVRDLSPAGEQQAQPAAPSRQVALFASLTGTVAEFLVRSEQVVSALLLPPLPRALHYIPPAYR